MRNGEYMDMKLLDEVKKMAALDQADKEFLKRMEKRMDISSKKGSICFSASSSGCDCKSVR